jgi:hypothetical protein
MSRNKGGQGSFEELKSEHRFLLLLALAALFFALYQLQLLDPHSTDNVARELIQL